MLKRIWKSIVSFFSIFDEEDTEIINDTQKKCEHDWKLVYSNPEIARETFYKCTKCKETKITI